MYEINEISVEELVNTPEHEQIVRSLSIIQEFFDKQNKEIRRIKRMKRG